MVKPVVEVCMIAVPIKACSFPISIEMIFSSSESNNSFIYSLLGSKDKGTSKGIKDRVRLSIPFPNSP
jgi:hypothetical protein